MNLLGIIFNSFIYGNKNKMSIYPPTSSFEEIFKNFACNNESNEKTSSTIRGKSETKISEDTILFSQLLMKGFKINDFININNCIKKNNLKGNVKLVFKNSNIDDTKKVNKINNKITLRKDKLPFGVKLVKTVKNFKRNTVLEEPQRKLVGYSNNQLLLLRKESGFLGHNVNLHKTNLSKEKKRLINSEKTEDRLDNFLLNVLLETREFTHKNLIKKLKVSNNEGYRKFSKFSPIRKAKRISFGRENIFKTGQSKLISKKNSLIKLDNINRDTSKVSNLKDFHRNNNLNVKEPLNSPVNREVDFQVFENLLTSLGKRDNTKNFVSPANVNHKNKVFTSIFFKKKGRNKNSTANLNKIKLEGSYYLKDDFKNTIDIIQGRFNSNERKNSKEKFENKSSTLNELNLFSNKDLFFGVNDKTDIHTSADQNNNLYHESNSEGNLNNSFTKNKELIFPRDTQLFSLNYSDKNLSLKLNLQGRIINLQVLTHFSIYPDLSSELASIIRSHGFIPGKLYIKSKKVNHTLTPELKDKLELKV
jgi:hypothetical protein